MARIIKFRGWDITNQKGWVYGDLVHTKGISKDAKEDLFNRVMVGGYEVDAESVGQFTGLIDKNGREVYEGDIVHIVYYNSLLNIFQEIKKTVEFKFGRFTVFAMKPYKHSEKRYFEVIGNIYEQNNK